MKQLNIGIIGAGRIGKVHMKSITYSVPGAKVLGITDVFKDALPALAAEYGIEKIYDNYTDMLADPEIDAVLVCSSTDTHADISIAAAKAGKHVFCEKPVDLTPEKVLAVIKAVKEAGVKLQVGFNRRFDHNFAHIRSLINEGKLGKLELIKITSRDPEPPPAEYAAVSGGIFLDMTIHDFDMACFIAGSEVEEVYVNAACLVDPAIGEAGDVDTAIISLKFKNGAIGVIDNSRRAAYGYDQRVEAFGSLGAAVAANEHRICHCLSGFVEIHGDDAIVLFRKPQIDIRLDGLQGPFLHIGTDALFGVHHIAALNLGRNWPVGDAAKI